MQKYVLKTALIVALVLFLSSTLSFAGTALNITITDVVDYNVTYNATDESEHPFDVTAPTHEYVPYAVGQIIIENVASEDLADINVTIDNTDQLEGVPIFNAGQSDVKGYVHDDDGWADQTGGEITFHIPDLPQGDKVYFDYTINRTEIVEPINVTKNTTTRLGAGRVFNNEVFNVTINMSMTMGDPSTRIQFNAFEHAINNFTFRDDTGFMDVSHGSNSTLTNMSMTWDNVVLNGTGNFALWNFAVHSPNSTTAEDTLGAVSSYNVKKNYKLIHFGRLEVNFTANDTVWDVTITQVKAKPKARLSVTKERSGEYTWSIYPKFKNNAETSQLYYQINKVSVWAIPSINDAGSLDPGDKNEWMNNSYYQWNETTNVNFPIIIAPGDEWKNGTTENNGYGEGHSFFNDTVVPIVWGKVNFTIVDNDTTVSRIYGTENRTGKYVYYQKILFLQGYFLEAQKYVEDMSGEGMFKVTIELTNRGNGVTPNSTLMADIIPSNMDITYANGTISDSAIEINSTDTGKDHQYVGEESGAILWAKYSNSQNFTGKQGATGEFAGATTYFWELKRLRAGETITVVYYINGTGEYFPGDMYVVGVDPVMTNRIAAAPRISSTDGFKVPQQTTEKYAVPLSLSIFALSMFSYKKKKPEEENEEE